MQELAEWLCLWGRMCKEERVVAMERHQSGLRGGDTRINQVFGAVKATFRRPHEDTCRTLSTVGGHGYGEPTHLQRPNKVILLSASQTAAMHVRVTLRFTGAKRIMGYILNCGPF